MKRKIIVGVWKDKLLPRESFETARAIDEMYAGKKLCFDACVAPSPVSLIGVHDELQRNKVVKAIAQDVHWPDPKRSFTGSTSIAMLKQIGIDMTMVGHSERRRFFHESDEDINKKLNACVQEGIFPILAIGDDVVDYKERREILIAQLKGALCPDTDHAVDISKIAIGYEPVWAISTWRNATALPNGKEVGEIMSLVAEILTDVCHYDISVTPLLYGGSVSPANAEEYFSQELVDGALVGGASLKIESLGKLYDIAQKVWGK